MEGKLIFDRDNQYTLIVNDNIFSSTNAFRIAENEYWLCINNCEAIKRGYDLDELADKYLKKDIYEQDKEILDTKYSAFIDGCKTIIEILSDKKFTDEDVRKAIHLSRTKNRDEYVHSENKIIQSLQKNKWNVLIDVEWNPVSNNCSSCGSGGNAMSKPCDHPLNCVHWKLKLDKNNKIILKIKS